MQAIDDICELNEDFLKLHAFTFNDQDFDKRIETLLEKLPNFLQKMTDIQARLGAGPHLVADGVTIADLVFFGSLWKVTDNAEAHQEAAQKIKGVVAGFPAI